MRPIQRIDSYTQPVSGSVAFDIRLIVEQQIRAAVPGVLEDAVFEVSAEPRGTYTGVTVFVQPVNKTAVSDASKKIEGDLENLGIRALINVRTWT